MSHWAMGQRVFSNGLPFDDTLAMNLKSIYERVETKKAAGIIIDGGNGEGKTTIGIQALEYLQGGRIDYALQYSMGGKDFMKKAQLCYQNNLHFIIYDEAGDFSKRASLTFFNRTLIQFFEKYRAYKILPFIITPFFNRLDNSLFDSQIVRMLINCYDRRKNYGNYRCFSAYRLLKMKALLSKKKLDIPQACYGIGSKANFYGHFYDLPVERSNELEKISIDYKTKTLGSFNI